MNEQLKEFLEKVKNDGRKDPLKLEEDEQIGKYTVIYI